MDKLRYLLLLPGLFFIAWMDVRKKVIPNQMIAGLLFLRLILLIIEYSIMPESKNTVLFSTVAGAFLGGGLMGVCYLLGKGQIGGGDVKLMAIVGMYVGISMMTEVLFFSFFYGALYVICMIYKEKARIQTEIPLGPFVFAGTFTVIVLCLRI